MSTGLIPNETKLQQKIFTIRGLQAMPDRDLAVLYQVETRALKQAVRRNSNRFPDDFMFVLTDSEVDILVSQSVIPSRKHLGGAKPFAFTEHGVAALSAVLNSERAVEINIRIMRAFVAMRRFMANNAAIFQRLDAIEKKQCITDTRLDKVFEAIEAKDIKPAQGIFFEGQVFDAYLFFNDLIRQAKHSIVLIDNFIDDSTLMQLSKRPEGVSATILTKSVPARLKQDLKKHNAQYAPIAIHAFAHSHDRFLILDGETVYHIGASLKDLGKKWFAFSRMDKAALSIMQRVEDVLNEACYA